MDRFAGGLSFVVSGRTASGGMVEIPVASDITRWGIWPGAEEPFTGGAPSTGGVL